MNAKGTSLTMLSFFKMGVMGFRDVLSDPSESANCRGLRRAGSRNARRPASRVSSFACDRYSSNVARLNASSVRCTENPTLGRRFSSRVLGSRFTTKRVRSTSLSIASAKTFRGRGFANCLNGDRKRKIDFGLEEGRVSAEL